MSPLIEVPEFENLFSENELEFFLYLNLIQIISGGLAYPLKFNLTKLNYIFTIHFYVYFPPIHG